MSKKEAFIDYVTKIMDELAAPEMSEEAQEYWDALRFKEEKEKPMFTDNGKLIMEYLKSLPDDVSAMKSKDIAEALNGKVQIASGAIPLVGMKGDIISPVYVIECKATLKDYYILKRKIVEKIEKEALKCGRTPLLAIRTSIGDFILFRVYDFFSNVPQKSVYAFNESIKIPPDIFKSLCVDMDFDNDNSELFLVGNSYWELISLDNFKNYIHWSD